MVDRKIYLAGWHAKNTRMVVAVIAVVVSGFNCRCQQASYRATPAEPLK